jgi:hypothetical protein
LTRVTEEKYKTALLNILKCCKEEKDFMEDSYSYQILEQIEELANNALSKRNYYEE